MILPNFIYVAEFGDQTGPTAISYEGYPLEAIVVLATLILVVVIVVAIVVVVATRLCPLTYCFYLLFCCCF